jgi:hypothetical protein
VVRVRSKLGHVGLVEERSDIGVGFLWVLRLPLPILIPPILRAHLSSGAGTIGQLLADAPSGLSHPTPQ